MRLFFVTDNKPWFKKLDEWRAEREESVELFCSPKGKSFFEKEIREGLISVLDLKSDHKNLISDFDLGFSCHCKQIFPKDLVERLACFNFHPGLNPYNRGWFPQVFSIINGLPVGATVHRMDSQIDHGAIVAQKKVKIYEADTSKEVYDRILEAEFHLFDQWIEKILTDDYEEISVNEEGNYNSISDFKAVCQIDLDQEVTFREAIDYLRAMTYEGYDNAYFYDSEGRKIYLSISLKREMC